MKKNIIVTLLVFLLTFALFAQDVVIENGNIKMIFHEYSGSVSLYTKSKKTGNFISVIDNSNYSVNSGFYLKIDNVSRKLERSYDIDIRVEPKDYGASVVYEIKNQAEVEVAFSTFASNLSMVADCIKVDVSVKNLSTQSHDYSVKAVFDTLLGEASKNHFFTASINPLCTEKSFNSFSNQKYIATTNGFDTIGFLLYGTSISEPELIAVANRDALLSKEWLPKVREDVGFDSINTFNNSALSILWRTVNLDPLSKGDFVFYITTATDRKAFPLEKSFPSSILDIEFSEGEDTSSYVDSYGTIYTVGTYSDNQLDPEYIADLLNRIHDLEIKADGSNRDEIRKLNAELDAILKKIKRINPEENGQN